MSQIKDIEILTPGGGELALAAMDEDSRMEMGRKTYNFVRRLMRNPEYRAMIKAQAEKDRAAAAVL